MPQPMWCCCRCRPHRVVCDLHNAASARILAAAVAYPPRLPCSFRDSRAFPGPIRSEMRGCLVYRVVRSPLPIAGPQGHRSARQVRHTFPVPKVMNSTKSIDAAAATTETVAKVAASPIEPHELTPTLTLDTPTLPWVTTSEVQLPNLVTFTVIPDPSQKKQQSHPNQTPSRQYKPSLAYAQCQHSLQHFRVEPPPIPLG